VLFGRGCRSRRIQIWDDGVDGFSDYRKRNQRIGIGKWEVCFKYLGFVAGLCTPALSQVFVVKRGFTFLTSFNLASKSVIDNLHPHGRESGSTTPTTHFRISRPIEF